MASSPKKLHRHTQECVHANRHTSGFKQYLLAAPQLLAKGPWLSPNLSSQKPPAPVSGYLIFTTDSSHFSCPHYLTPIPTGAPSAFQDHTTTFTLSSSSSLLSAPYWVGSRMQEQKVVSLWSRLPGFQLVSLPDEGGGTATDPC